MYAKITKHQQSPKQKLDLPVSGPFQITGKTEHAWNLLELASGKSFLVHADFIIQSARYRNQLIRDRDESDDQPDTSLLKHSPTNSSPISTPVVANSSDPPEDPSKDKGEEKVLKEELDDLPTLKPPVRIQPPRACKNDRLNEKDTE